MAHTDTPCKDPFESKSEDWIDAYHQGMSQMRKDARKDVMSKAIEWTRRVCKNCTQFRGNESHYCNGVNREHATQGNCTLNAPIAVDSKVLSYRRNYDSYPIVGAEASCQSFTLFPLEKREL